MERLPSTIVTYSAAYTIVPTYECFNRCSYCNFRLDPGKSPWLTIAEAQKQLETLAKDQVREILILSGEVHPDSPRRQAWLQRIYDIADLALNLGFLPHSNVGPLKFAEMQQLKEVNVSMGLMLEQVTPKLLTTVHQHAPSKLPEIRLKQLEYAGRLGIPFTTGILLGIGENLEDCWQSLSAIAQQHQQWGHIQEVILQPYSPGTKEIWSETGFNIQQLPKIVAQARQILPESIRIQIPPNLIPESQCLLDCLDAGARDLGGIVPKDEVNPDYSHLDLSYLKQLLAQAGWDLVPRLPVYPQYYSWLSESLQKFL